MNYLENKINQLKNEILDLKTANKYTSTRNVNIATFSNLHTGLYQIEYERDSFMSDIYPGYITAHDTWAECYARTTNTNLQVIEINSTTMGSDPDGPRIDNYITLTVIASVKIIGITRIS